MLINADQIAQGQLIEADICIIGAGAAGITLAREFAESRTSVCVLEAGAADNDTASQALYSTIRNLGRPYPSLHQSRTRFLGGSTNCWTGNCIRLRPINFERRSWSEHSGWPITLEELEPYYRRAETTLGIDGVPSDPSMLAARLGEPLLPFDPKRVETVVSRYNPLRFGTTFRADLERASNVKVVLGANVTSIESNKDGARVERLAVRTLAGREFGVRARTYVLATGGIENARLLLASRSVHTQGLGNQHDVVGRFFTTHIWYDSGVVLPAKPDVAYKLYTKNLEVGGIHCHAHLTLPEAVVRTAGISDFRTTFKASDRLDYTDAVQSATLLRDELSQMHWPDHLADHLARIMKHPEDVFDAATGRPGPKVDLLQNVFEQAPNPTSRIALATERDAIGIPIATIDWRLSEIDRETIRVAHDRLALEVGRCGFGRMLIQLPADETMILEGADGGAHHMGTTRMNANARQGVVDQNCRVHGVGNLYVAGSSVFPTGGFANPTLTILALTARLGDHLKADMLRAGA